MPKITYLKEFDGELWARLELDGPPATVHILTDAEILEIKTRERKKVWEEIKNSTRADDDEE